MIGALSLPLLLAVFAAAGVAVVLASIRATKLADIIADRTRMGEAMAGGLVLGGATSLLATGLLMTAILLGGLILRQREGPARLGIESVLMMAVYATAVTVEIWGRG